MPSPDDNIFNKTLQDKIDNVGSDMIMDALSKFDKDGKEQLKNLEEAIEMHKEEQANEAAVNNAAIGNADLSQMLFARPRHIKPLVKENSIRRNDPCPCGSGKKYKNCCLETGRYETYARK